jgi:hypothetical protein
LSSGDPADLTHKLRRSIDLGLFQGRRVFGRLSRTFGRLADRFPSHPPLDAAMVALLARNERFRDVHRGRRCFVIGNGPSLASQDLTPLAGEITFAMNAFWKHPLVDRIRPTYFCMADPLYFDGSPVSRTFLANASRLLTDSTIFVPTAARTDIEAMNLPPDRTHCFLQQGALGDATITDIDFTHSVPAVQSVSQAAIELALFMGCSPIYLLGLDHDWLSHLGADRHFYEGQGGMEQHTGVPKTLADVGYGQQMAAQLELWKGYETLSRCAARRGCQIQNATRGGFLDVFPRTRYEAVIGPPASQS